MMDFSVSYDVAVVGGGIAGVAAAVQAARSGQKTVLIEKNILLGGLATSGLVYIYLPICDGNSHQTSYGITEELLRNSITLGPGDIPEEWPEVHNAPERQQKRCRSGALCTSDHSSGISPGPSVMLLRKSSSVMP